LGAIVVTRRIRVIGVVLFVTFSVAAKADPASPSGVLPGSAQAATTTDVPIPPASVVNIRVIAALQAIAAQNQCMLYSYDHNGNITARTDQGFGTATWGSSMFGCFKWTAP
jgi:hypothetical protein